MSEEKLKGTLYEDQEVVKRFRDFENRYYQEVRIAAVTGECPYGHREGETYCISNCNNDGLCGALVCVTPYLHSYPALLGQSSLVTGTRYLQQYVSGDEGPG